MFKTKNKLVLICTVCLSLSQLSCAVKKAQNDKMSSSDMNSSDTLALTAQDSLNYQRGIQRSVNEKLNKKNKKAN